LADDPVGGDFSVTGSAELGFPLYGESFRGVVFSDVGTVEPEFQIGTIRSSVGFGFRMLTPMLGDIALDFALPLSKSGEDETEWLSFSFGIQR
jgi:outer membrane protein insertion porin family